MAHRFRLAKCESTNVVPTETIDLITSPWKLIDRSWSTETCKPSVKYDRTPFGHQPSFQYYDYVIESFSVIATDTVPNLLYELKRLEDVLDEVRQYHDLKPAAAQWWLEWHVDGEEERRALLYTGQMEYPSLVGISPMIECLTIVVKFTLVRHPLWENDVSTSISDTIQGVQLLPAFDKWVITNIEGTAPARIANLEVYLDTSLIGTPLHEYWIGIRPYHNGVANFDGEWQCENGTIDDVADTSAIIDGTASNSAKQQTDFATDASLIKRFHIQTQDVATTAGNEQDYVGRYLVLVRAKTTVAGTTVGIQLRSGYSDQIIHEEIYMSSTSWFLYELGEIELPPASQSGMNYGNWIRSFMLSMYAERLAGTGSLDCDLFILIPSEHFLHVSGSVIDYDALHTMRDVIYTSANDTMFAIGYTRATPDAVNDALSIIPLVWYIPQEGGAVVMAGQSQTQHNHADSYHLAMTYYPRWLSYRYDEQT